MKSRFLPFAAGTAFVLLAGCIPELATPEDFQDRVTGLRIEWDEGCPAACADDPKPSMCDYPADFSGCTLYDDDQASDCVIVMQKVVKEMTCSGSDQRMKNLGNLCAGVFSGCPDPAADETGGADDAGQ